MRALVALYATLLLLLFLFSKSGRHLVAKVLLRSKPVKTYKLKNSTYGAAFNAEFTAVCKRLKVEPAWLNAVFVAESGWKWNARNSYSGALGFIQFLPSTLKGLGSSPADLLRNDPIYQLRLIEKYYKPIAGRLHSAADLRLYTFYPAALDKPNSYVIGDSITAAQNFIYDLNCDHKITVGEFRRVVQ